MRRRLGRALPRPFPAAVSPLGGGVVRRPWLGAKLQTITPEIAENLDLARPVRRAGGDGARRRARRARRPQDRRVITAVDGQPVDDPNAFEYRFMTKPLGRTAELGILRGGKETRLAVNLETAPETPRDEVVIRSRSPFSGVKVANLSPALAEELQLDAASEGVVIVDVADGSVAQNFGFQRGDRVLTVNNDRITRTRDLERAAGQQSRMWRITIERGGKQLSVVLGG